MDALLARVRAEAAKHGRDVRFSVSFRPILAATERPVRELAIGPAGRLLAFAAAGIGLAFLPFHPDIPLTKDLVFYTLLPPLIF